MAGETSDAGTVVSQNREQGGGELNAEYRMMEQSAARYNEEQAANAVAARQQFLNQMWANHAQMVRQIGEADAASFLRQVTAIQETIQNQNR